MRKCLQAIYMNNGIHADGLIVSVHKNFEDAYSTIQKIGAMLTPVINVNNLPYGVTTVWIEGSDNELIGKSISSIQCSEDKAIK